MNVEIISIGDEILIGQIVNTNASYIAEKLTEIGYDVNWITTVGDDQDRIWEAIQTAEKRTDVILATGGLGPTHDDITKTIFAGYFNSNLILNEEVLQKIKDRFRRRRIRMAKTNKEQALVPDNATIIENSVGTAAGLLFEKVGKYFFVLPGVPVEMIAMMESYIIPFLKSKVTKIYKKRILHTTGIPESTLFEKLGTIEELEKLVKIAFLPTYSGVNVRLSVQGQDQVSCQKKIEIVENVFREKISDYIWGVDDDTIEKVVANLLINRSKSISVAEFGTNGNITAQLASVPEVDKFLNQGLTIGSVDMLKKIIELPASQSNLSEVINQNNCEALSRKIKQNSGADISLAIMHNDNLDVTTHIAYCDQHGVKSQRYIFTFHPSMNFQRIAATALKLLYQYLTS